MAAKGEANVEHVTVNEVGLRDGLQNQAVLISTEGKLDLIRALVAAGVENLEVTSFVSPKAVPQMADAADLYMLLPDKDKLQYSVLVPNVRGYERAIAVGAKSVALVLAASDTMNKRHINMSLQETIAVCCDVVRRARKDGIDSRCYISGVFLCPFEGPIPNARIIELAEVMFAADAGEVIIADPLGIANPARVQRLFCEMSMKFDLARISAHFHDTRALALANVWAALQVGVRKFDSSIGGLGGCPFAPGATGNLATEDLVLMLAQCGFDTGINVEGLCKAIEVAEGLVKRPLGGRAMLWLKTRTNMLPITY
jgi:hydroxymethylglutaryl-CoA lyase